MNEEITPFVEDGTFVYESIIMIRISKNTTLEELKEKTHAELELLFNQVVTKVWLQFLVWGHSIFGNLI